jgi:hypothetical protein
MGLTGPLLLSELWQRLTAHERQQLCHVLSLLIARRLLPATRQEVADEQR